MTNFRTDWLVGCWLRRRRLSTSYCSFICHRTQGGVISYSLTCLLACSLVVSSPSLTYGDTELLQYPPPLVWVIDWLFSKSSGGYSQTVHPTTLSVIWLGALRFDWLDYLTGCAFSSKEKEWASDLNACFDWLYILKLNALRFWQSTFRFWLVALRFWLGSLLKCAGQSIGCFLFPRKRRRRWWCQWQSDVDGLTAQT